MIEEKPLQIKMREDFIELILEVKIKKGGPLNCESPLFFFKL